jgi:hypothetical protein
MWESAKQYWRRPAGLLAWGLTALAWISSAIAFAGDHPELAAVLFGLGCLLLVAHDFWRFHRARTEADPYVVVKEILGVFNEQGEELLRRKARLRPEDADEWGHRLYDFICLAFGLGEAQLFQSDTGLIEPPDRPKGTAQMAWTYRRLQRLGELLARSDSLPLTSDHDFAAELRRVKEARDE